VDDRRGMRAKDAGGGDGGQRPACGVPENEGRRNREWL
jgi:Cu/Zn superoxide dismutase